jgi:hypothetical protein
MPNAASPSRAYRATACAGRTDIDRAGPVPAGDEGQALQERARAR